MRMNLNGFALNISIGLSGQSDIAISFLYFVKTRKKHLNALQPPKSNNVENRIQVKILNFFNDRLKR